MPNSKSLKSINPDRVRAKNDYIEPHKILSSFQGTSPDGYKIKSTKKHRKSSINKTTSISSSNSTGSCNVTNNNTNLINLSDKLLGPRSSPRESKSNDNNLSKLMISAKKINSNNSDNEDSFVEIRTLPIDLSPNCTVHKEKLFCKLDNADSSNSNKNYEDEEFGIKRMENNISRQHELVCLKCGKCCCHYCSKRRLRKQRFQKYIDLCSCVHCLRLADIKNNNNNKNKSSSSLNISSTSLYCNCCSSCSSSSGSEDTTKKSPLKNRKKKSFNSCLRFTCLSTLALTLMPCLLFYWPLRLLNELIFKSCYCGNSFEDDSPCKCDSENNNNNNNSNNNNSNKSKKLDFIINLVEN